MTDDRWSTGLGTPATAAVLVVFLSLAVGVATAGPIVTAGATFEASSSGPTITVTEQLELDDSQRFPDGNAVDLSPHAIFSSSGDTTATVDRITGPWTNVSTTDVSNGLEINATDKQSVSVEGSRVSAINISSVDPSTGDVGLAYDASASVNVTITGLSADTGYRTTDVDSGTTLGEATADGSGTATFTLDSGTRDVTIREVSSGGGGGGGGRAGANPDNIVNRDGGEEDEETTDEGEETEEIEEQSRTIETRTENSVSRVTFGSPVEGGVDVEEVPPDSVADGVRAAVGGGSDGDAASEIVVVQVLNITPTSTQAREMAATVELTIASDKLTNPERAVIVHETADGWKQLDTSAASTSDGTTTLTADAESFSLFAVVQFEDVGETQQTDDSSGDDGTTDGTAGDDGTTESDDGTAGQSDPEDGTAESQTQEQADETADESVTDDSDGGLPLVPIVLLLVAIVVVTIAVVGYRRQSGDEARLR